MKIETAAHFVGPNVFAMTPLIRFRIAGMSRLRTTSLNGASRDILLELLPDLRPTIDACEADAFLGLGPGADSLSGAAAQSGADSLSGAAAQSGAGSLGAAAPPGEAATAPGIGIGHAIEHVALALQNQAGGQVRCVRNGRTGPVSRRTALVAFEEAEVAAGAAELACELVERLASDDVPDRTSVVGEFAPRIQTFLRTVKRQVLPVQDRAFVRAAQERDVPTHRIAGRLVQLGQGTQQSRVSATKTTLTNVVSNDLAANKDFARRILADLGLPTPRYERVYRNKDAVEAAKRIGFPVVVKPNQGNMGQAVSVGMRNAKEVSAAYKRAREVDRSVLVEAFIPGEDFRILVINGEFCAASKRTPGHVVGDGVSSVEELVVQLNADPRRGTGPRSPWTRLELDEQADRLLADRDMTRSTIPLEGETVFLRRNANTSDGGTAMDVTEEIHPENREIAVRAARAIGLDIAGVDFLTTDISRSMWRTGGVICEINSRPGLRKHMWPANGPARDIMTPIVDMLYPPDRPSRIPVVGVLGIDKSSAREAARLLSHLLVSSGRHVGLAVDHRVYINGRKSRDGRMKAPEAARRILLDPEIEVAVLELTVNDVVRDGLGCDAFDFSIIVPALTSPAAPGAAESASTTGTSGGAQLAASAETGQDTVAPKVRDAIRVMTETARSAVYCEDETAILDAIRSVIHEPELVVIAKEVAASEEIASASVAPSNDAVAPRVAAIARQAALRLGLTRKEIRRALRSFDKQTARKTIRARNRKQAKSAE